MRLFVRVFVYQRAARGQIYVIIPIILFIPIPTPFLVCKHQICENMREVYIGFIMKMVY